MIKKVFFSFWLSLVDRILPDLPYIIASLIGGLLMGLTVAPTNLFFLAWIAFVPLYIAVWRSFWTAVISAILWGFAYHGFALFWITGVHPMTWMGVSWFNSILIALFCWLFITFWGVALVVTWAILSNKFINHQNTFRSLESDNFKNRKFNQKGVYFPWLKSSIMPIITSISLWCCLEKIWSLGPLWWSSLSFTQSPYNLLILQSLKLSGITIVTALILLVNCLIAQSLIFIFQGKRKKFNLYLVSSLIILFTSHLLGFLAYQNPIVNDNNEMIKVGFIQGNIPNEIKFYDPGVITAIENYSRGYRDLAPENVDLIITPETALPFFYKDIVNNTSFYSLIEQKQVPIVLGAFKKVDRNHYKNSLFVIDGEGTIIDRYDKIKLVPLGEYVPFNKILGGIISRLSPLDTYLLPGDNGQTIQTTIGQVTIGICYDSAFSGVFRRQTLEGGKFIITSSNNAHYSDTMPTQHHAQDIMRAIENDRWVARVSNTGYSGVIDPKGNTIWISQLNQYQIHHDIVYGRQNLSFYVKYGDWLSILFALYLLFYFISEVLSSKLLK